MKKILFILFVVLFANFQLNAQENETNYNWQVRLRGIAVIPNESATIEAIGGDVAISNAFVPELDFTYFFNKNLAVELILGTTRHDVKAVSTAVGDIDLGDVWLLPPTLTLQYHLNTETVRPYIGAGLNYTLFYGVDEGPVADDVEYDSALGFAFQLGFDFDINDRWFLNLDAKYILLNTDVTVDATSALGATVGADVDINPFIAGFGLGYKF
ncbi:MAG: OmpW family outer membrane protein [Flavobacteriaceae bacterium]|nr:OmpW family protein [Mangrovimonas sp.]MCB0433846.1 OmpW family protein [Mangrovimonas sp.]MCB0435821.1 OmpW family protein [Mangrovimonas sp.]MCB0438656.1 OmpW family protein [Mangrovimonas sp.]